MISECKSNVFFSCYMRWIINSLKLCAKLRVPLSLAFYARDMSRIRLTKSSFLFLHNISKLVFPVKNYCFPYDVK